MLTYDYDNMRVIHTTGNYTYVWRFDGIGEWKEFNDRFLEITVFDGMQ